MGLLDSLFDPQSYGGGGGLLSRLLPDLAQIPQSQGFAPQGDSFAQRFQPAMDSPLAQPQSFASRFQPAQTNPLSQQIPNIGVGGYQMPRMGSLADYTPQQDAMTPPNAQPTQGQLPQAPQTAPTFMGADQGVGIGDRLSAGFQNFANAGGPLQAIAGGVGGLLSGNRTDPAGMQQQNLKAQFDAVRQVLIANGETPQAAASKAMVAALNPEAAKTILPELFTNKTELKMVKDALGAEHPYSWNAREQTLKPVDANGEGSSTGASGGVSFLAPGVKQFDPTLNGDAYLAQFGPEVKAAVKAYINGDVMPTGNPRAQAIATKAKEIAQKYGQDTGTPVSDTLYAEKRKYRTELGTNSPNSAGGQAKAFNQGISHLSALADTLEKLDNSNGLGIPAIAGVVNSVRQGTSTTQSAISDEAKTLGQTVAGEVGKLFSGSAGGGVHERELTRERFDTVKSKPQLAAALKATIETMQGGLQALEQRRDAVLGPSSGVELVNQETRDKIAKIQGVIDRLEGKGSATPASTTSALPSGWSVKVR